MPPGILRLLKSVCPDTLVSFLRQISSNTSIVLTDLIAGREVKFEGIFITYKPTGLSANMFQTLQPGETVTSSVNVAKTHKLAGVAKANVQAIQNFKYVTGTTAPTSLKEMLSCGIVTSESISIKPDQSRVAR